MLTKKIRTRTPKVKKAPANIIKINNTTVSKIELPEPGQKVLYWDEELKGFLVKAVSTGVFYMVQRRAGKGRESKLVKYILGKRGEIPADTARDRAAMALAELRQGINLNERKKQQQADKAVTGLTLKEAYTEFIQSKPLRPRTVQTYDENINRTLTDWLDMPLTAITPEMVHKKHKHISTAGRDGRGVGSANQAMRLLRVIFNYVIATKNNGKAKVLISENPVKILSQLKSWNRLEPRDTVIQPDDLEAWHQSVTALESEKLRDFFLFLIFSGLRRNETMRLQWSHFDTKTKVLTIPKELSKTGRKRQIPLTDVLHSIYKSRKAKIIVGNPYVFQGMHGKGHLTEPKRGVNQVKDETGVNWSSHDLRRTYATIASKLDVSYYKLKYLLGHSVGGDVTGKHYAQVTVDDVRDAAQEIADYLKKQMKMKASLLEVVG